MKNKKEQRTWRDLQSESKRGMRTRATRVRKLSGLLKVVSSFALIVAFCAGMLGVIVLAKDIKLGSSPNSVGALVEVDFQSDGVLNQQWFQENYRDTLTTRHQELDLRELKQAIEHSEKQVAEAHLRLELPGKLFVELKERSPLFLLRVMEKGKSKFLLVARDGVIYEGKNYPSEKIRWLPGVSGLKLKRMNGEYLPIDGIETLAHLLDTAQQRLPSVFRHWKVIDLSEWSPSNPYDTDLIRIKGDRVESIVFSSEHIELQLEQLSRVLEHAERYQMEKPREIDLSYGRYAVIRYN